MPRAIVTAMLFAAAVAVTAGTDVHAQTRDELNPGRMGINALPPRAAEASMLHHVWSAYLGVALQHTDDAGETSLVAPFRVEHAFGRRASLFIEGMPFELMLERARSDTPRVSKADIWFGSKFVLLPSAEEELGIAFRMMVKTTTGKNVEALRFLNAPGYLFDLLFGRDFRVSSTAGTVQAWASLGFIAWQQAGFGQNDGLHYSASVRWLRPNGVAVRLDARGYAGWQPEDAPFAATASVELPLVGRAALMFGVTRRLRDPEAIEGQLGIRMVGDAIDGDSSE